MATVGRWVGGSEAAEDVWAEVRREGHEAVVRVEIAENASAEAVERLRAVRVGPDGAAPLWLERTGLREFEARFALDREGVHRVVVQAGDNDVLRLAPVSLPYSPEFEPRVDPGEGRRTLARLAEIAEGRVDPPVSDLLAGSRDSLGIERLGAPLAWAALLLLLAEVAVRRWGLRLAAVGRAREFALDGIQRVRTAVRRGRRASAPQKRDAEPRAGSQDRPTDPAPPPPSSELSSVLDRARRRASGRR